MDLTWISVVDTAIKIGFGAIISAMSGYLVLIRTQNYQNHQEQLKYFYVLQEEKKSKYVEFLSLSQELVQTYLYKSCQPASEDHKRYLRIFNELQIISNDAIRIAAYEVMYAVQCFICISKYQQERALFDGMVADARRKISIFQKVAQQEVMKEYKNL